MGRQEAQHEGNFVMLQKHEKCAKCMLSTTCGGKNNEPGWGNRNAKLVILMDDPGDSRAEKLLIWLLMRMSLGGNDAWIDYVFKCALPRGKPKKADLLPAYQTCWNHIIRNEALNAKGLVVAGNWGAKFVLKLDMKNAHGKKDPDTEAWVCYSMEYALMAPGECVEISQVIWRAAEEAGLKPKMNLNVPPFQFPSKKLAGS